ncbi:MAG: YlmC/YmxH family sporulation protein [Ruminococcaceae bacterium]|nr:YlmC/YmxH family sporulation protein [Oscillospiraceae bacterium]
MSCRIDELRNRQVVCVKNGCVLGYVSDIELDTETGKLTSLVIYGKPKLFGVLGHENDIIIPWEEIVVIGNETILVSTEPIINPSRR